MGKKSQNKSSFIDSIYNIYDDGVKVTEEEDMTPTVKSIVVLD